MAAGVVPGTDDQRRYGQLLAGDPVAIARPSGATSGCHAQAWWQSAVLGLGLGAATMDNWTGFFRSMLERGLRMPTTATSDGAPGLIRAIEVCFPAEYPDPVLVSLCRPQDYADVEPDSLVGQGVSCW
jgi:hypothetical protein